MMSKELKTLNRDLKRIGRNFSYVNYGGCGCVAAMLSVALRPKYPIMRIVQYNGRNGKIKSLDTIRNNMKDTHSKLEWSRNGLSFAHLWVEVFVDDKWYGLDSDGVRAVKEMYRDCGVPADGSFTIDEIQALAATDSWNEAFDRSQLPAMQQLITATIN